MISCSSGINKNESVKTEEHFVGIENIPKVDVEIELNDSILNKGDKIILKIKLTNNGSEIQKLLFDKPITSTGGPWGTTGKVINLESKSSVLKYENKAILSSQFYTEVQLINYYYNLQPGQSIERKYALSDIVVFDTKDYILTSGKYQVQLFYNLTPSNTLNFRMK
ncbi:hypothetical protein A7A78_02340 [Aequorivita soesokkakensis]|uniref:Uncharacterized protein n=1 Tax=Aequorivita soesokkakensis TaxID=1385699 RepID=A0A1A9LI44_9FLAO|nr:hypothetical protein A7A78_02340 [Aequorivita soesokkakensis]